MERETGAGKSNYHQFNRRVMKKTIILSIFAFQIWGAQGWAQLSPVSIKDTLTKHGPEKGSLLIIGGNVGSTASIWEKFAELAGGKDKAVIVVITTASGDSAAYDQKDVDIVAKETGVKNVTLLHTSDLKEANSEKFIAPLTRATGVYIVGGRQWRLADSYLNTLTHKALWDVL